MGIMHDKALWLTLMSGSSAVAAETLSDAMTFLNGEDGLALLFDSDEYYADTGFPGSAAIVGGGTQDGYDTSPDTAAASLLTYTAPSVKMTMGPSGTLRFGAHNLFLNSASPANQSVTVVSGATYAIILTGSVTTALSGAATGTITAGTTNITAATTTLTFGSTSGTGTVQVTRTPADLTHLVTAGSVRISIPYEWDTDGVLQGIRVEESRTNLCLYSDDLTNAAWTKSNMTTAKTATGPDGVANSATTCTATAGNATALQAITSASAARVTSVYLKRRTGTGNIDITQDNGSTWTTQAITSSWARYSLSAVTSTNPTVGIRVVTSGDAVDVALFDHEVGSFITSPIPTIGSTVTRAADNISLGTGAFPASTTETTLFVQVPAGSRSANGKTWVAYCNPVVPDNRLVEILQAGAGDMWAFGDGINDTTAGAAGNSAAFKYAIATKANDAAWCLNGGTVEADTSVSIVSTPTVLQIGSVGAATSNPVNAIIAKVAYFPTRKSDADLQTLTTP